jgi:hypothetical protein
VRVLVLYAVAEVLPPFGVRDTPFKVSTFSEVFTLFTILVIKTEFITEGGALFVTTPADTPEGPLPR